MYIYVYIGQYRTRNYIALTLYRSLIVIFFYQSPPPPPLTIHET